MVEGVLLHEAPSADYDSNFWLCTITLDSSLRIKGQENAYKDVVRTAVGGAAGVIHAVDCANNRLPAQRECGGFACFYAWQKNRGTPGLETDAQAAGL